VGSTAVLEAVVERKKFQSPALACILITILTELLGNISEKLLHNNAIGSHGV
jgi:hypothetical protein